MATLEEFRLSSNQLQGKIHSEFGILRCLKVAWLHRNDLTGIMPDQFAAWVSLVSKVLPTVLYDLCEVRERTGYLKYVDKDCGK
jgi:hypothetical protein